MVCVLSQYYQHFFWKKKKKNYLDLEKRKRKINYLDPISYGTSTVLSFSSGSPSQHRWLNLVEEFQMLCYRPFSHCIDQAGLGAFTAKSGHKHYNPPSLTVMWMNFDSPNFPSFCSLSAIISFQTCSNKCILYVLSFHKCIKIKYKMVNIYGVFRD